MYRFIVKKFMTVYKLRRIRVDNMKNLLFSALTALALMMGFWFMFEIFRIVINQIPESYRFYAFLALFLVALTNLIYGVRNK